MNEDINRIKDHIFKNMQDNQAIDDNLIIEEIENHVFNDSCFTGKSLSEKAGLIKTACNLIVGYNKIQELMDDDDISEIMINKNKVFYEKGGVIFRWQDTISDDEVALIIQKIGEKSNRSVNSLQPISDASVEGGLRTNTVLFPISVDGNIITIRKFPKNPFTSQRLIENMFLDEKTLLFLKMLVKAKYNLFICGGAGSGKTTLLNVLSEFIDSNERIITIEDSVELSISHIDNLIRLEARKANSEGKGEVSIEQLIKTSLRMRPDRIIVGEVRGREALDMLQAMNTGHDGSISTGHSNSCRDMISRLETMILSGKEIPLRAIRNQIRNAIDIFIFVSRQNQRRVLYEICEVIKDDHTDIRLNSIMQYNRKTDQFEITSEFNNIEKLEGYQYVKS
ncbi:MAG: CpaF family protein [Clostridia bacterium]|nr:CpaF family protein [Clostridia bacterium]